MLEPIPVRVVVGVCGVFISLAIAWRFTQERGVVVGVVTGLVYLVLLLAMAVSPRRVVEWSARHDVADATLFVPLAFFALLLLRPLPPWGAALIALGLGAMFVPLAVRRRRRLSRDDGASHRQRAGSGTPRGGPHH
ncbi:hypothetical protein NCC78_04855 [Micromonospora phytophila]|uniref:hypothetical protein n=1 Tax=Micromonospora phytophila TaxID=709888 RepID=UPI00202F4D04|nr:hypothetical protein [Micromonospora phytophila]MCM0674033.1 hypothetical protein [Micromonospora phytophila]